MLLLESLLLLVYALAVIQKELRARKLVSPLTLFSAVTVLHFSIPGIITFFAPYMFVSQANLEYSEAAMVFIFLCFAAFHWSNYLFLPKIIVSDESMRYKRVLWNEYYLIFVIFLLAATGWIARIHIIENDGYFQIQRSVQGNLEGPFFALFRMIELFPMHALCMACIFSWTPRESDSVSIRLNWGKIIAFLVVTEAAYWLPTGRKEETIYVFLLPLIIFAFFKKRLVSGRLILGLTMSIAALFPASFLYRNAMQALYSDPNISVIDTILLAFTEVIEVDNSHKSLFEATYDRLNLIEPVSACMRLIADNVWSHFYGQSYADAIISIVPRYFWPSKPEFHYGNEFGFVAGYLHQLDNITSISVTFIGEAFLNFGWPGFLVFVIGGLVFQRIYHRARISQFQQTWILLYVLCIPTLIYVGGTFALYAGGLIKLLSLFYVVGMVISGKRKIADSSIG